MIKGIIFDLDGTLADTMNDLQTAMNGMLSYLGYSERSRTDLVAAINNGAKEFVRRSLPKDVQNIDFILKSAIKEYEKQYSVCYVDKTAPYEGVEAMLMNLKQKGIKLAVLSNKQDKFVKDIVSKLFDKKTFMVVQGQEKAPLKPNGSVTLAIAKKMGVKPSQCLFVGDSDVDMQTAINADNMRSVGVCWGYRGQEVLENAGATFLIKKPEDLCAIVEHLKDETSKFTRKRDKNIPLNTTENCEFFNKKLMGTSEFSIIKQGSTGETNTKSLSAVTQHNTKKLKDTKSSLLSKKKKKQ